MGRIVWSNAVRPILNQNEGILAMKEYHADIVVVGAGTSGSLCAVAAARCGLKTILIERTGLVGGVPSTTVMGSFANLMVNTKFEPMTGGIIRELIERIVQAGGTPYSSADEAILGKTGKPFTIPFHPALYEHVLIEMLEEVGVHLILNCAVISGETSASGGIRMDFAAGMQRFCVYAEVVVDATGNAEAAALLGAETCRPDNISYGCLMRIGAVEIEKTLRFIKSSAPWKTNPAFEAWLRQREEFASDDAPRGLKHLLDPVGYDHAPMSDLTDRIMNDSKWRYIEERYRAENVIYTLELSLFRELIRQAVDNGDFCLVKYFFFDSGTLNGFLMSNTKIEVNQIHKDEENNPLFREDFFSSPPKRWEVRYDNSYPNLIYDPKYKVYRCYYTCFSYDSCSAGTPLEQRASVKYQPMGDRITSLCYAESPDGIHFTKPALGLVEFDGSTDNNILMRYAHGTGVFLDTEELDPNKRFKLITKVEYNGSRHYMAVAFSEDGIHFTKPLEWPRYNPAADTHNFVLRDPKTGKFLLFTRIWKNGVRICARSESTDFINWTEPVEVLRGSGFASQVYSMVVFPYNGLYLGMASIYHNGDAEAEDFDTVDVELKYSTKSDAWESIAPGGHLIQRGKGTYPRGEFDCGCIYAAAPVEIDGKLWIYYMGGNGRHSNFRETSFARGWIEKDKFAGYIPRDPDKEGKLVTSHFCI